MMRLKKIILLSLFMAIPVIAKPTIKEFESFLNNLKSADSYFSQTIINTDKTVKKSEGTFVFQKPNRFSLITKKPYEQQVISNGKVVYQVDPILEQVIIRKGNNIGDQLVAKLLTSNSIKLKKDYEVKITDITKHRYTALLKPKQTQGVKIVKIVINTQKKVVENIAFINGFDQKVYLSFKVFKPNVKIKRSVFSYKAGKNMDVVDLTKGKSAR